MNHIFGPVQNC